MQVNVTKDNVTIMKKDIVHEGEYNVNHIKFEFSDDYTDDLVKNAIFKIKYGKSYQVSIINNECDIPTEILSCVGEIMLGVYAYKVTNEELELRYSPYPTYFNVIGGSYNPNAEESQEITPTQFEQYMQALQEGLNQVSESIKEVNQATDSANDLVDKINQKLENGDFIGPQGHQGVPGKDGTNGQDGVGITTITSGQPTVEEDKTITPVIVTKTDGSSEDFNVEAKNGLDGNDGQNGKDGLTPTIGDNGNWFIGDTDTGKPSRGEVGPSPDLSDYVKNTDYAKDAQGGVISTGNHFRVYSNNGVPYVNSINSEQYSSSGDNIFIGKGTLENIKDDYVGSSSPVITLNNALDNLVSKNRASDYIISLKDALKYKVFEFLVHGKVKQESTTGKNLLFEIRNNYLVEVIDQEATTSSLEGFGNCKIGFKNSDGSTSINLDAGTYYISFDLKINSGNQSRALNLIAPSNRDGFEFISNHIPTANYQRYCASFTLNSSKEISDILIQKFYNDETCSFKIKNVMISSSSDYTYEPYTGGQPSPSPDYPQEIKTLSFDKITRCGKNLFDYEDTISVTSGITVDDEGWITISGENNNNSGTVYKNYFCDTMRLKYNTDYNIVIEIKNVTGIGYISFISADANKSVQQFKNSFNKQLDSLKNGEIINAIMTSKADFSNVTIGMRTFVSFVSGQSGSITFRISVLEDTTVTPQNFVYEPYQATEYAIDLQGNEMVELPDGVKDELVIDKEGNVSLVKNIGKVVLDGSEDDWNMIVENEKYRFSTGVIQNLVKPSTTCLSNYFISGSNSDGDYFVENTIEIAPSGGITICTYVVSNSVEELKVWLQEHNVTVYYQLANPQPIPLGKLTDIITTLNGTNNISINGNVPTNISATYALDIKKYVDNKLAEISTAMIEEG